MKTLKTFLKTAKEVEQIDEAIDFFKVAKAFDDYAKKHGGMDKKDFIKVGQFVRQFGKESDVNKNDRTFLQMKHYIDQLDTDVRDGMIDLFRKHGMVKNNRLMRESVDLEENKIFFVKVGDGRDSMTVKTKAANKSDALKKLRSQYPKDKISLDRNQKQGEPAGTFESVDLDEDIRTPPPKKAPKKEGEIAYTVNNINSNYPKLKWRAEKNTASSKAYKPLVWSAVVESVDLDEDYDEVSMAVRQLHFIQYAAEEISDYLEMSNDMEEWYQNKLANVHSMMQTLHSYAEGDKRMSDADDPYGAFGEEVEQVDESVRRFGSISKSWKMKDHEVTMRDGSKKTYRAKLPSQALQMAKKDGHKPLSAGPMKKEEVEQIDELANASFVAVHKKNRTIVGTGANKKDAISAAALTAAYDGTFKVPQDVEIVKLPRMMDAMKILGKPASKVLGEEVELDEVKRNAGQSATGYDIYHKTYSDALQHAYAHAEKKHRVKVDMDAVHDKVAMGPKKPSSGKTNSFILPTNTKKNLHVQVYNTGKNYELNMYVESVEEAFLRTLAEENQSLEERSIKQVPMPRAEFDKLRKGSIVEIDWDGAFSSGAGVFRVVSKSKSKKYDVEKVRLQSTNRTGGVAYYLYSRSGGDATLAIGDMGAIMTKSKIVKESVNLGENQTKAHLRAKSKLLGGASMMDLERAGNNIRAYAKKGGGSDKKDFDTAADYVISLGRLTDANKAGKVLQDLQFHVGMLDTDVRDKIKSMLPKGLKI